MLVPDKLPYTKPEKRAEAVCGAAVGIICAAEIALMISGYLTGAAIIPLMVSLVVYGVFSLLGLPAAHEPLH